jgi:hypothetical protein
MVAAAAFRSNSYMRKRAGEKGVREGPKEKR